MKSLRDDIMAYRQGNRKIAADLIQQVVPYIHKLQRRYTYCMERDEIFNICFEAMHTFLQTADLQHADCTVRQVLAALHNAVRREGYQVRLMQSKLRDNFADVCSAYGAVVSPDTYTVLRLHLQDLLRQEPPLTRRLLSDRYSWQMNYAELSRKYGMSERRIRYMIRRHEARLREQLREWQES